MPNTRPNLRTSLPALVVAAIIASSCSSSSDDDGSGTPPQPPVDPTGGPLTTYVAQNGASNAGTVVRGDEGFAEAATFDSGANEGVDLDYYGNLYHAGDSAANGPEVRVVSRIRSRSDLDDFTEPSTDRLIAGASTTLMNPKGIHLVHGAGLLLVADVGTSTVTVFGTTVGGDAAPIATSTLTVSAWDIFHDEANDRLFLALTDGTLGVIDGYAAGGFAGALTRLITPDDGNGAQISTNLHGIAYDSASDTIVVSDVGDVAVDDDGSIYVIEDASTADGLTTPSRVINGPSTFLGNPVDITLDGARLRVAEKANGGGRLLIFNEIFTTTSSEDVAPGVDVLSDSVESLTTEVVDPTFLPDASDLDGTSQTLTQILTTRNDGGFEDLNRHDATSLAQTSFTDTAFPVESVDFDVLGDVYMTADDGAGVGTIIVVNRGATAREGEDFTTARDRAFIIDELGTPKGIEVVGRRGLVMVADTTAMAVLAFTMESFTTTGASVTSVLSLTTTDIPWDLDYDGSNDRLFVALTNGTVDVFDNLLDGAVTPTVADRNFSIADMNAPGTPVAVNLHGIVYDALNDRLIVSDVNETAAAGFGTDGRIFVIEGASEATGVVTPSVQIEGPATLLGNPVDIAFDGVDLLVAEKVNGGGQLLRFEGIASIDTSVSMDVAPDATASAPFIESVAAVPTGLAPQSGGSIQAD